jgi:hypothetical protein
VGRRRAGSERRRHLVCRDRRRGLSPIRARTEGRAARAREGRRAIRARRTRIRADPAAIPHLRRAIRRVVEAAVGTRVAVAGAAVEVEVEVVVTPAVVVVGVAAVVEAAVAATSKFYAEPMV